jgi:YjbE family integral membrane protein
MARCSALITLGDCRVPFGLDYGVLTAFLQVILIDLVLAGDNAVVIGLAAAGLPQQLRAKAILIGIIAATVLRICFALITTQLLSLGGGLLIAGGLLLLWVCWKMYRELRGPHESAEEAAATADAEGVVRKGKTLGQAVMQIIIADVSMSLDNVLAVAGAAQDHLEALVFGLALSVLMMGLASALIARILDRFRWIAYLGLAVILYVAVRMIYHGADQLLGHTLPVIPFL